MTSELIVSNNPKSRVSEAMRSLRTNLEFTFVDNNIKTIMVTSSMPGEGKSFISSNLASAFALTDKKVLIIDCDMRLGRQHYIFKVDNDNGLSHFLVDSSSSIKKYIKETGIKNLSLITRGVVPPNPSELLNSNKFKDTIDKLRKDYDLIILDCPPANAVSDAMVLSKVSDEALIVATYNKTPTDLLLNTKKTLDIAGIKIAGIVANKCTIKKNDYYRKYYK